MAVACDIVGIAPPQTPPTKRLPSDIDMCASYEDFPRAHSVSYVIDLPKALHYLDVYLPPPPS